MAIIKRIFVGTEVFWAPKCSSRNSEIKYKWNVQITIPWHFEFFIVLVNLARSRFCVNPDICLRVVSSKFVFSLYINSELGLSKDDSEFSMTVFIL